MEIDFRRLFHELPGLLWTAFPDGRADFVNKRWCEYTGFSLDQARGEGWQAAVHPDDRPHLVEGWLSFTLSGEAGELEARLRRFDGEYRWFAFRFCPLTSASGEIVRWCGINTDIEDRKRAEEAQRAQERRAQSILDGLPAHVMFMTPDGELESANRYSLEYFGKTLEELKVLRVGHSYHPDDSSWVRARWRHSVETGQPCDFEARSRRMDGDYRWLHTLGFPLRDGEGRIVVWYILSIDVTDRKRSEEKLRQVRSELAHMARVSSLGVLTASIAHEINQPLSGIVANAGTSLKMLAAEPPKVSGAQQTTQRIVRDVNRAADIVKRLRALFVKRDATREAVDLNDASREVVALFSSDLQRKQVVVNSEFAEELPGVTGDRVQLQQVILNLLMNAADAMRSIEGRPRQVMIRTEREDTNRVRLTVRDAGIGLEPQVAERLFEAFFTTKTEGMGIGLSISRTIIDNHGGRIWAEPNDGPGVTFAFSIPCDFQDASSVHVSPHDAGGPSCGLSDGKS